MVQHYFSLEGVFLQDTWLTIGSFDGLHLGHQQLIHELNHKAHTSGMKSVVLTFHPHPAVVLRGRSGPFYLTTTSEKVKLLDELGIDFVVTHPFTYEISQSSAHDFVTYLSEHLKFRQLWVGSDFALGKGREGDVTYLTQLGKQLNYHLEVIEPVTQDGQTISSSYIRNLLLEGNVEDAAKLLGRYYPVDGKVIHGDGRGKQIGIPTANLETSVEKLIPGTGVYACRAQIMGEYWPAAVNIGIRPTFESSDHQSHLEAHILDFSADLYSTYITLDFISRLRGEERFQNVDELIRQEHLDIGRTREIIASL